jgi:hypothetical protein
MSTIVTRAGKGSPLTNNEVDSNFTNLNTDKVESITSADGSVVVSTSGTTRDLSVGIAGSTATLISQIRNQTGATLTKGTVVYISGAAGNKALVSKALATGDSTSAQTYGMVQADISNNQNGYVVVVGAVSGLNTSAFADGTQLYLSGVTAGTYTSTKPYAPTHLVYVGVVTYSHATQGTIQVKIQNGYEMDEIHDVSAQSPTNGDTLVYNSSTGLWTKTAQSTLSVASAATLATARNINGVSFNGSADITVADSTKLPLSGGTLSGTLTIGAAGNTRGVYNANGDFFSFYSTEAAARIQMGRDVGSGGGAGLALGGTTYALIGTSDTNGSTLYVKLSTNAGSVSTSPSFSFLSSGFYVGTNLALHAGNYNSYSPTLTGTGASGTWGINVTGNANSASTLNSGAVINGTAYFRKNQTAGDYTTAALWTESYGNTTTGIAFHISGVAGRFLEMRNNSSELFWQSAAILNSGNYNSYSPTLTGTGASGTWGISISGTAATATSAPNYLPLAGGTLTGNLGVGASSPLTRLDTRIADAFSTVVSDTSLNNNTSTVARFSYTTDPAAGITAGTGVGIGLSSVPNRGEVFLVSTNPGTSKDESDFAVWTTTSGVSSENFRVRGNGNVGVGTTSPSQKLEVYQSNSSLNVAKLWHVNGNAIIINASYNYYDAYNHIFRSLSGTTTYATIDNNGNFGLGTTAPSGAAGLAFVVNGGSAQTRIALKNSTTGDASGDGFQILLDSGSSEVAFEQRENAGIRFITNNVEALRILNNQNVGIGTTGPVTKLQVNSGSSYVAGFKSTVANGFIALQDSGTSGALTDGNVAIGAISNDLAFRSGGATRMRLDANGDLGLGYTPNTWYSTFSAIQIGASGSSIFGRSENNSIAIGSNVYVSAAGSNTYIATNTASYYEQLNGTHAWYYAASGTAGTGITFTQAMSLSTAGALNTLGAITQNGSQVLTAGNYNSYALPLTGGTLSGLLTINGGSLDTTYTSSQIRFADGSVQAMKTVAGGVFEAFRAMNLSTTAGTTVRVLGAATSDPFNNGNGGKVFIDAVRTATNMDLVFSLNDASGAAPVERVRFMGSGNVGVGTSSPAAKLHLGGNTASAYQAIFSTGVADSDFKVVARNGVSGTNAIQGYIGLDYATGTWPLLAGIQFIRNSTSGELAFTAGTTTSASEQARLTATGLGIGTTSPTVKLDVSGAITNGYTPTVRISRTSATLNDQFLAFYNGIATDAQIGRLKNSDNLLFGFNSGVSYATSMTLDTSSNLTTVGQMNATRFRAASSTAVDTASVFGYNSTQGTYIFSNVGSARTFSLYNGVGGEQYVIGTDYSHIWYTNTAERMRITSAGNLGLGVTPQSWYTGGPTVAQQIGANTAIISLFGTRSIFASNYYLASGSGTDTYIATGFASQYYQESGAHRWFTAPSGTAGTAITFTQAMSLSTAGALNTLGAITQNGSQVLTAGNYNSYAPTLTGTGASGTWGISITGNAATATTATNQSGGTISSTGLTLLGGQIYVSPTNINTLNSGYAGGTDMWLNYKGQADGFTQFRNLQIGDGKGTDLFAVNGSGGWVGATNSLRAPIFYDSANTAYFLNPNGGDSNLGGLTLAANVATNRATYGSGTANLVLLSESTYGRATIDFRSGVNYPSDGAQIYYETATDLASGETSRLVIRVENDATDSILIRAGQIVYNSTTVDGGSQTTGHIFQYGNADRMYIYSDNVTAVGSFRAPIFYDSNDTARYVDPTGTSTFVGLTVTNTITGNISGYSDYIAAQTNPVGNFNVGLTRPKGASYTTTASTVTGAIKIKMPPGTPVHGMWKMTVKIYEYGQRGNGYTIELGCHLYPSNAHNRYQYMLTTDSGGVLPIRYGTDGTSGCIWIGENGTTWSYPQIHVTEFSNGFNNPGSVNWSTGTWAISIGTIDNSVAVDGPFTTSLPVAASVTGGITTSNYNSYSPTLTGTGASGSWGISVTGTASGETLQTVAVRGGVSAGQKLTLSDANHYVRYASTGFSGVTIDGPQLVGHQGGELGSNLGGDNFSLRWNNAGDTFSRTSSRAPIFYDSGNTAYYVDPASTSNVSGDFIVNHSGSSGIQLKSTTGTQSLWIRTGWDSAPTPSVVFNNVQFQSSGSSGGGFTFWSGNTLALTITSDYAQGAGSLRAPVFYDSNDTGRYVDPTGTSTFVGLTVTNTITGSVSGTAAGSLALTGGTLSGTLQFNQPVGLGFANGQYIKDNGGGGLVIYSGNAVNINGTSITINGNTAVHAGNYGSYALPLTGGTLTGTLSFSNSGTSKRGVFGTCGDNDFWFVGGGATASNSGFLEIATGDDGQTSGTFEPIYVSQYGPGDPLTGTLTRRAKLLDENGNTIFPLNVTAYSDERLKTNWRAMPDDYVTRLAQVKVGIYDRTDEDNITQVGVGAQSLQTLLPEAILTADDDLGTLSVNYGGAALASAVELAKEVVDLRNRVAHLESLINKLIGD